MRISTDVASKDGKATASAPDGSAGVGSSSSVYFLKKERGPLPATEIGQAVLVSSAVDSSPLNALYLFVHNIFMPQLRLVAFCYLLRSLVICGLRSHVFCLCCAVMIHTQ